MASFEQWCYRLVGERFKNEEVFQKVVNRNSVQKSIYKKKIKTNRTYFKVRDSDKSDTEGTVEETGIEKITLALHAADIA